MILVLHISCMAVPADDIQGYSELSSRAEMFLQKQAISG